MNSAHSIVEPKSWFNHVSWFGVCGVAGGVSRTQKEKLLNNNFRNAVDTTVLNDFWLGVTCWDQSSYSLLNNSIINVYCNSGLFMSLNSLFMCIIWMIPVLSGVYFLFFFLESFCQFWKKCEIISESAKFTANWVTPSPVWKWQGQSVGTVPHYRISRYGP